MKRIVSVLLLVALFATLCACGKSEEAIAVDEMILAIGEVTVDSEASIAAAEEAYNALSEKDKKSVENYAALTEAKETFVEVKAAFEKAEKELKFSELSERLTNLNEDCGMVCRFIYALWDDVGPSNLFTYLNCILMFEDESSLDLMKSVYAQKSSGQNGWIMNVIIAGQALNAEKYEDVDLDDTEMIDEIVSQCIAFTSVYYGLTAAEEELSGEISEFIKTYKDEYPDETDLLREWSLESSMFVDFASEPSGSLVSYGDELSGYKDAMSRFQKTADSLK